MWLQHTSDNLKAPGGFDGDGEQMKSSIEALCDKLHYSKSTGTLSVRLKIYSGKTNPKAPYLKELPA